MCVSTYNAIMTTAKRQPQWRVILYLRIPGTIPGGYPEYPDQLRDGFLTVVMVFSRAQHVAPEARKRAHHDAERLGTVPKKQNPITLERARVRE